MFKLSQIKTKARNPRKIDPASMERLKTSVLSFSKMLPLRPIVYDTKTGEILGGNQRYLAILQLIEMPEETFAHLSAPDRDLWLTIKEKRAIPDDWVKSASELSAEEKRRFVVADNANFGEWDMELLKEDFDFLELQNWGIDLEMPDFGSDDTEGGDGDNSKTTPTAEEDDFDVPVIEEVKTDIQVGDLFEIGRHRLLCGDSTDKESIERLIDGEKCDLLTDPPYGISANKQTLGSGKKDFYRGDNWDIEVPNFFYILDFVEKAIVWGGNYFADKLPINNDWLCWHKKNDGLSFSEFELAWSNIGKNCRILSHHWSGEKKLHPTMKPVKVMGWCIEFLEEDTRILDLFLGSGSTMVAAHQLNRKCFGLELDPKYCEVIVTRMIKLDPTLTIKRNGIDETEKWLSKITKLQNN